MIASSPDVPSLRPSIMLMPTTPAYSSKLIPSTKRLPVLLSSDETVFCPSGMTDWTPSVCRIGPARSVESLKDSDPLNPSVPDARNMISAPTFASRFPRSRIVPLERPTVKTISKTPTAMPSTLTTVRAGR